MKTKPDDWKKRQKKALKEAKEGEHAWFFFKDDTFHSCAKCGIIKRADGRNSPCKGMVKITLRNGKK